MPKSTETINQDLEDLLTSRGLDPELLDSSGKEVPVASEADLLSFHFHHGGHDLGTVTASIDGLKKLTIYYDDQIANSGGVNESDEDRGMNGTSWISLVKQLKKFAQRHQLGFVLKDTDRLRTDMKKRIHQQKLEESANIYSEIGFSVRSEILWPSTIFESTDSFQEFSNWLEEQRSIQIEPQKNAKCILAMVMPSDDATNLIYGFAVYIGQNETHYMLKNSTGVHEYSKKNQIVFNSKNSFGKFEMMLNLRFGEGSGSVITKQLPVMETHKMTKAKDGASLKPKKQVVKENQMKLDESSQLKDDLEFMSESAFKQVYGVGKREFVAEGWKQKVGAGLTAAAMATSAGGVVLNPARPIGPKGQTVANPYKATNTKPAEDDAWAKIERRKAAEKKGVAKYNQMKLDEIGFANELGKLPISDDQIIANSTVDGRMSTREVMIFTSGSNRLYFFTDGKKINALVLLDGKRIAAMKGSVKGLVYALFKYLTDIKRLKMMIDSDDLVTTFGIDWLTNQISRPGGIKITNSNGQPVDANELRREWLVSRSDPDRRAGPTSLMIGESADGKRLRKNEQSLMPYDIFGVSMKSEKLDEGYYGNKKMSYNDDTPTVKMIIKHNKQIEETDQRFRHIEKIFLETSNGERFVVETTKPSRARMFARHIAEGGGYKDERWNHIKEICEDLDSLGGFVRATNNKREQFNESAQRMISEAGEQYQKLRETVKKLSGSKGYNKYFESYEPRVINEDDDDLSEAFKHSTIDNRIEKALPTLNKFGIKMGKLDEATMFEDWADSIIDESLDPDGPRQVEALIELLSDELSMGPNAEVAIGELEDVIENDDLYNRLRRAAAVNPDSDARPQIIAWMQEQDDENYRRALEKIEMDDSDSGEEKQKLQKDNEPESEEPTTVKPKPKKPATPAAGGMPPPVPDAMGLPPLPQMPPLAEGDETLASFKRLIGR